MDDFFSLNVVIIDAKVGLSLSKLLFLSVFIVKRCFR